MGWTFITARCAAATWRVASVTATNDWDVAQPFTCSTDMMQMGFRESTRSGLSFGTDDLVTPDTKPGFIKEADKERDEAEEGV